MLLKWRAAKSIPPEEKSSGRDCSHGTDKFHTQASRLSPACSVHGCLSLRLATNYGLYPAKECRECWIVCVAVPQLKKETDVAHLLNTDFLVRVRKQHKQGNRLKPSVVSTAIFWGLKFQVLCYLWTNRWIGFQSKSSLKKNKPNQSQFLSASRKCTLVWPTFWIAIATNSGCFWSSGFRKETTVAIHHSSHKIVFRAWHKILVLRVKSGWVKTKGGFPKTCFFLHLYPCWDFLPVFKILIRLLIPGVCAAEGW